MNLKVSIASQTHCFFTDESSKKRKTCSTEKAYSDGGSRCCIAVRTRMENAGRSGVGKVTVAMLMENTIAAAEKRLGL